jgi:predicted phage gp36 major capsid-like protein
MLINRRALTILPDPYSAGFCILYKLFARFGGGIICPNALRLLRVK